MATVSGLGLTAVVGMGDFGFTSKADDVHCWTDFGVGTVVEPVYLDQIKRGCPGGIDPRDSAAFERTGNAAHVTWPHVSGADKGML